MLIYIPFYTEALKFIEYILARLVVTIYLNIDYNTMENTRNLGIV